MSDGLFADSDRRPLADRLRPQAVDDVIGQEHLLAATRPLARLLKGGSLHSMILWGPPGCGKTTLAELLIARAQARRFALSAVTSGVREVRAVIDEAQSLRAAGDPRISVLFVDEVHHFNKSQQDAFLPHVEGGLFVFIGATTENPSFEINGALLSRLSVYALNTLDEKALEKISRRAAAVLEIQISDDAVRELSALADGDARRVLNILECAVVGNDGVIDNKAVLRAAGTKQRRFDKGGDNFYDQISALHKSVRGSDPDAALYWFCRMLDGGCDGRYLGRRLIRMASEDVGLADPSALEKALAGDDTYRRLGSPEGELALAQVAVYLACVPKSNALNNAYNAAVKQIKNDGSREVPRRLRNAPTKLMKAQGNAQGYRYAHDEPDAYAAGEHYFPDDMSAPHFYQPTERGFEAKIAARLRQLRARDKEVK